MHQELISILHPHRGRHSASHKAQTSPVLRCVPTTYRPHGRTTVRRRYEGRACTQNKVLVIMDYGILRKQAYRGTGCQRDSISKVTNSKRKGALFAHKPANWT